MADVINMFDYFDKPEPPQPPLAQVIYLQEWIAA